MRAIAWLAIGAVSCGGGSDTRPPADAAPADAIECPAPAPAPPFAACPGSLFPGRLFAVGARLSDQWNSGRLATADLDGDGALDVVVTDREQTAWIFFGQDGGLSSPIALSVPAYAYQPVIADFDRDGALDVVVLSSQFSLGPGAIHVFHNVGNRTFTLAGSYATVVNPFALAVGDLDRDGTPDIGVANYVENTTFSVFYNAGNATFTRQEYPSSDPMGYGAVAIALGDLDSNGSLEVVLLHQNRTITVSTRGPTGYTTRVLPMSTTSAANVAGLVVADLDRDGDLDLAASYLDIYHPMVVGLCTFSNDGRGRFTEHAPLSYTADNIGPLVAGDATGDGIVDLVSTAAHATILRNLGDGTFAAENSFGRDALAAAFADLRGDGHPDLLVTLPSGVAVYDADGRGVNMPRTIAATQIELRDLDHDGTLDMLVLDGGISVRRGTGAGVYAPAFAVPLDAATAFAVGDLDGDGNDDVAVAIAPRSPDPQPWQGQVALLWGDGSGGFGAPVYYPAGPAPYAIVIEDANGDCTADLVLAGVSLEPPPDDHFPWYALRTRTTIVNHGDRTFAAANAGINDDPGHVPSATADVDGDGKVDSLALADLLHISYGAPGSSIDFVGNSAATLSVADADGDGIADVIEGGTLLYQRCLP